MFVCIFLDFYICWIEKLKTKLHDCPWFDAPSLAYPTIEQVSQYFVFLLVEVTNLCFKTWAYFVWGQNIFLCFRIKSINALCFKELLTRRKSVCMSMSKYEFICWSRLSIEKSMKLITLAKCSWYNKNKNPQFSRYGAEVRCWTRLRYTIKIFPNYDSIKSSPNMQLARAQVRLPFYLGKFISK